jgi:hypothetical protein
MAKQAQDLSLTTPTTSSTTATSSTAAPEDEEPSAALSQLLSANAAVDVAVPADEADDGFTVVAKGKRRAKS